MPLKILATSDLHLGRRPARLPQGTQAFARALGPAGAWQRLVTAALEAEVDAVVLAGDLVEHENDFYEAYRELRQGVEQLSTAGIAVYAVVGNHDVHVLPRLAGQLDGLRLLGRGGEWEAVSLQAGGESATLWGWSFPRPQVNYSPLAKQRFTRGIEPTLGVLHCDRGASSSHYAPVSETELAAAGLDCWLLGHIHAADAMTLANPGPGDAAVGGRVAAYQGGYLGSPVGTDPGEPGGHGPWLITIEGGLLSCIEQWQIAPLRWERVQLDLTGIEQPEEARVRLLETVRELDQQLGDGAGQAVGLRVTLSGQSDRGAEVAALFADEEREHLFSGATGSHYFIERMQVSTRPPLNLAELAVDSDPPGLLARQLLLLERPPDDPQRQELLAEARRRLEAQTRDARWQELGPGAVDEEQAVAWLWQAGMRLLERMRTQRVAAAEGEQ